MKKIFAWLLAIVCLCACLPWLYGCSQRVDIYTKYEITAEYAPETKTLAGTVKVTFKNPTDKEISLLKFQLYPNAYRENALYKPVGVSHTKSAYYTGESYGEMEIFSVHGSKNWEITGEDENILSVFLERGLYPNEKVVLDIGFLTKFAEVNHRTGVTKKTVNLGNFYPVLCGMKNGGFYEAVYYDKGDPFYGECADYTLQLKVPKEYTLATTGKITEERTLESKKEYFVSAPKTRDLALVLSDKFRVMQEKVGGVEISYYYYADQNPTGSFAVAKESFAYYEKTFGDYPYGQFSVAETGFCFGGMEYPQMVMISDEITGEERWRTIAHETAHQWWYAVVGSDQIENAWQDEGLVEYSTASFFEKNGRYGLTREKLVAESLKEYRSYYDIYGSVLGRTDTRMHRSLGDFVSEYEYRCIAYDKPLVMLDTLRKSVGDKKFYAGLRKYYSANKFRMASVGDLVGGFEKAGIDAHGFFEGFLNGKVIL